MAASGNAPRLSTIIFDEGTIKTTKTDAFWQSFFETKGIEDKNYDVVSFGDSPGMADELAALVVRGPKRATAGLLRDYQGEPTAIPVIGGYAVVVNGGGDPLCVFQTTDVRIGPLSSVALKGAGRDDQIARYNCAILCFNKILFCCCIPTQRRHP